ncbi:hypothetical protein JKP88DRAFT_246380 [Tribonema minus]|uniref:Uncharacterized protein n=1 Tax=Tribonema minus TaxID=303371 RepID=A0A835Z1D1_9STRA|nr:hypothetical protein JKP88DRAFT_246380 [Tribonema minus]
MAAAPPPPSLPPVPCGQDVATRYTIRAARTCPQLTGLCLVALTNMSCIRTRLEPKLEELNDVVLQLAPAVQGRADLELLLMKLLCNLSSFSTNQQRLAEDGGIRIAVQAVHNAAAIAAAAAAGSSSAAAAAPLPTRKRQSSIPLASFDATVCTAAACDGSYAGGGGGSGGGGIAGVAAASLRLCARSLCNFAGGARSRPKMSDQRTVRALLVLVQVRVARSSCGAHAVTEAAPQSDSADTGCLQN